MVGGRVVTREEQEGRLLTTMAEDGCFGGRVDALGTAAPYPGGLFITVGMGESGGEWECGLVTVALLSLAFAFFFFVSLRGCSLCLRLLPSFFIVSRVVITGCT